MYFPSQAITLNNLILESTRLIDDQNEAAILIKQSTDRMS